jgi:hypothetical protein
LLVTVDKLSKMVKVAAAKKTITAEETAELLVALTINTYGRLPASLISDRDTRFTAEVWEKTWSLLGTQLKMTTAKRPQADGQTERANRQVLEYLRKYCNSMGSDWDSPATLALMEFALNSHKSTVTGQPPLELLLGRTPRQPTLLDTTPTQHTVPLQTRLRMARDASLVAQEKMVGNAKLPDPVSYSVGEMVLLNTRNYPQLRQHKLSDRFVGPFRVSKVLGPTVVQLELPQTYQIHNSINTESIKKFITPPKDNASQPPEPTLDEEGNELFEVEKILGERVKAGKKEFKVRWRGYGPEDDSWEPHSFVQHLESLIEEFRSTVPKARARGAAAKIAERRAPVTEQASAQVLPRRSGRSRR